MPIRTMRSASPCHMCGRCDGFRGAIRLGLRSPNHEIVNVAGDTPHPWETVLILFGMMGVALGAFHWAASPWFIQAKQYLAEGLVAAGVTWPLEHVAPWWILTNYPAANDVMTILDGFVLLAYIAATALAYGAGFAVLLAAAVRAAGPFAAPRFHHLAQTLIPLAGCGVFLGLFSITVAMLKAEGFDMRWVTELRAFMLAGAATWCIWLGWKVCGRWANGFRRAVAASFLSSAAGLAVSGWVLLFWVW